MPIAMGMAPTPTKRLMMDFLDSELPIHKRCPKRITITVSRDVYERLCDLSQRQGRSISNLASFILETHLGKLTTDEAESRHWREKGLQAPHIFRKCA